MSNHIMFQFFHWRYPREKQLWKDVAGEAKHLSALGISAVWLPPACKTTSGTSSVGYDIYDHYDLGEFDQKGSVNTKYGNRDEYLQAIQSLHENGIQVYADVILNHKAGADETEEVEAFKVNPDDRREAISEPYKIKAFTKFTFPGRQEKYSSFKWDFHCFTGVDWDDNKKEGGIYKILNDYGEDWENIVGDEKGNFDYLMFSDIESRNPAVRKELEEWGLWYLENTGVDGFRLDAVKHISFEFAENWLKSLRNKTGKEIFAVGENATTLELILEYIKVTNGCMSLFDFPLHVRLYAASREGKDYDLRYILDDTLVKADPTHCVTFTGNHDSQPLREYEAIVEPWFKPHAYALILLREQGYPCVFYPDLYGAHYKGKNEAGEEVEIKIEPCAPLEKLLIARKNYAYGFQRDYFNQPNLIGWTRSGTEEEPSTGCALVLSNEVEGEIEMEIGQHHAGKTFYEFLGHNDDKIVINDEGKGTFPVNAASISAWVVSPD